MNMSKIIKNSNLLKLFCLSCAVIGLSSCINKTPYEIKSPCVAAPIEFESLNEENHNIFNQPCIRRPVNKFTRVIS